MGIVVPARSLAAIVLGEERKGERREARIAILTTEAWNFFHLMSYASGWTQRR